MAAAAVAQPVIESSEVGRKWVYVIPFVYPVVVRLHTKARGPRVVERWQVKSALPGAQVDSLSCCVFILLYLAV